MPLGDITIHLAVPQLPVASGDYAQGEPATVVMTPGVAFDCFLQMPTGSAEGDAPKGNRRVKPATLKYEPFDIEGGPVDVRAESEVLVTAIELTGPDAVRWQVIGDPLPYAPPGDVIGYEAQLRRVED